MMQHYLQTKEKYKDCILFYRLGDFYEMFFEDAIKVSALLELTLTGKDCGLKERAPMCGIPYHAADVYIAKLVSKGEKVAICEQLSEPNGKNLVSRDVIRIITAGTVTNNELIDDKKNNFLGSICLDDKEASFSWADITTGEFFTRSFTGEKAISDLFDSLSRVSPVELIGNKLAVETLKDSPFFVRGILPKIETYTESEFSLSSAYSTLLSLLKVSSLVSFGISENDICVRSAGALVSYLLLTQKHALLNFTAIKKENGEARLMLDLNAVRNLELIKTIRDGKNYGSLLWVLDKTRTSMGARKLSSWVLSPLGDAEEINGRLSAVNALFKNNLARSGLYDILSGVKDIGRLAGKIANGNLSPKDCVLLKTSLALVPNVKFVLSGLDSVLLTKISDDLFDFSFIVALLENAIFDGAGQTLKEGGFIKTGYSSELDELRDFNKHGKTKITELENRERTKTGIKNLKISYNRVFGYYIEITNSFKDLVPYDYVRRQTLANAERYVTEELKVLEEKILSSEEKSLQLENTLYKEVLNKLEKEMERLKTTAEAIATLDVLLSLSVVAKENGYVMPEIKPYGSALEINGGRHPVVEAISKQNFVPNDCYLNNEDSRTMILTGPNMAGKSTYMRQVALITLMAHVGSFVPAKSAVIPLTDKIFTRIGASDSLISDQSTFMVEMNEVADIINNATENSLLILDEIGRGTSTYDGLSIAWSIVEYVTKTIKAKTLFATHYHELTELEGKLDGVKNYKITVKELPSGIVFLRTIMRGGANRSFGIEVADLAGVKKSVTERAKEILKELEKKVRGIKTSIEPQKEKTPSKVERIISDLDMNNVTPIQAFNILSELREEINKDE